MSLRAYQQASERAEQPRDSEYRLFGEVTRALMEAAETPADDFKTRIKALDWNRRLWMTLAADCARPNNALAADLRAQIISLSMWVGRHTSAVVRQEEAFEPLIEINRIMMQGLGVRGIGGEAGPAIFGYRVVNFAEPKLAATALARSIGQA